MKRGASPRGSAAGARALAARVTSVGLFGLVALATLAGCQRDKEGPRGAASALAPLPDAPAGLMAELAVANPGAFYDSLRALGGPRAAILPASAALGLAGVLGLPAQVASALVLERPLVGALVLPAGAPAAPPAVVLGLPLRSGVELVLALSSGAKPELKATREASGLTLLSREGGPTLGVLGDFLIVSREAATIAAVGPYVARVLGARPPPAEPLALELGAAALHGPASAVVRERWASARVAAEALAAQAQASEGRPPDFGDPAAILGMGDAVVQKLLEALAASERLRLTLTPGPSGLELALTLDAVPGSSAEKATLALATGPLDRLLTLPRNASVGLLTLESDATLPPSTPAAALSASAAPKASTAPSAVNGAAPDAALLKALAPRLTEKDAVALLDALSLLARGRGKTTLYGLLPDKTLLVRTEARDREALERGMSALFRALRAPALSEPLAPLLGKLAPRETTTRVPGLEGPAHQVTLVAPSGASPGLSAWWALRERELLFAAGASSQAAFQGLLATEQSATLAANAELAAMVRRHATASTAVLADLAPSGPGVASAPALLAFGRRDRSLRLELELSAGAVLGVIGRLL